MDVYNIAIAVFVYVLVSENVLCAMLKQESEGSGILGNVLLFSLTKYAVNTSKHYQ